MHCRNGTRVTNPLLNAPWTYKWHSSEPRRSQLLFDDTTALVFTPEGKAYSRNSQSEWSTGCIYIVIAHGNVGMSKKWVRKEKSLKPACIKAYIVANCKCHLIQPVLTWLWGSMCFLALLDLHPKFTCTASSARARSRRWHYVTRKRYPGASCLPLWSASSEGKSLGLGISLAFSCSHCLAKPSTKLQHFSWV